MGYLKTETAGDRRINLALAIAIEAIRRLPGKATDCDLIDRSRMAELLDHRLGDDESYLRILQAEAISILDGKPLRQLDNVALITPADFERKRRRSAV